MHHCLYLFSLDEGVELFKDSQSKNNGLNKSSLLFDKLGTCKENAFLGFI